MATRTKSATKAPATKKAPAVKKTPAKRTEQMKKPATKKAPAKKTTAKKAATPDLAAPRRTNLTYVTKESDRRMIEGSARSKVHAFVEAAGSKGVNRDDIEHHFENDEHINVKSSLDYLVKFDLMNAV